MISVSKRHFKRAVKRNRVKRQIREAYRHHKNILLGSVPEGKQVAAAFIWLADELCDSSQVESSVRLLLGKVAERV
jgi:ribonuclease P protein component